MLRGEGCIFSGTGLEGGVPFMSQSNPDFLNSQFDSRYEGALVSAKLDSSVVFCQILWAPLKRYWLDVSENRPVFMREAFINQGSTLAVLHGEE